MRRLILLRHAKSDWPGNVSDIDRPLNARGAAAAPRVGAYVASEGLHPAHVMVSPARRTVMTWEAVRPHLRGLEAEIVPSIYESSRTRLLDAVHSAPESADSLLLIGHNPGLQDLAEHLIGAGSRRARMALAEKFPTAALAVIDVETRSWSGITPGAGRLERFVTPRALAEADGAPRAD